MLRWSNPRSSMCGRIRNSLEDKPRRDMTESGVLIRPPVTIRVRNNRCIRTKAIILI